MLASKSLHPGAWLLRPLGAICVIGADLPVGGNYGPGDSDLRESGPRALSQEEAGRVVR